MSGKILPPPPKPVSPLNSTQITGPMRAANVALPHDVAYAAHPGLFSAAPVAQGVNGLDGHPPPPPPHSPPPPTPKSARICDLNLTSDEEVSKPGYPPPPPPHSPPPPPPPKSQSGHHTAAAPAPITPASIMIALIYYYVYGMRIYPASRLPPDGNTPNPPRPHPDPVVPPPPPPRVDLNKGFGVLAGVDLLHAKTAKLGTNIPSFQGLCSSGVAISCV